MIPKSHVGNFVPWVLGQRKARSRSRSAAFPIRHPQTLAPRNDKEEGVGHHNAIGWLLEKCCVVLVAGKWGFMQVHHLGKWMNAWRQGHKREKMRHVACGFTGVEICLHCAIDACVRVYVGKNWIGMVNERHIVRVWFPCFFNGFTQRHVGGRVLLFSILPWASIPFRQRISVPLPLRIFVRCKSGKTPNFAKERKRYMTNPLGMAYTRYRADSSLVTGEFQRIRS